MTQQLHKNDVLYYARIMPTLGLYDVYELKIRTIDEENRWFCGMEKRTKIAMSLTLAKSRNRKHL